MQVKINFLGDSSIPNGQFGLRFLRANCTGHMKPMIGWRDLLFYL